MIEQAIVWAVFVSLMAAGCFLRPRLMRGVVGVFFAVMGVAVHGAFVLADPGSYVTFAQQAMFPGYQRVAEATVVLFTPVGFGLGMLSFEVTLAVLMLGRGLRVRLALFAGICFLLGITPLGIEVVPNAILAVGLARLALENYPRSALAELSAWWASRTGRPCSPSTG